MAEAKVTRKLEPAKPAQLSQVSSGQVRFADEGLDGAVEAIELPA